MSILNLYNQLVGKSTVNLDPSDLGDFGATLYPSFPLLSPVPISIQVAQGPVWEDPSNKSFTITGTSDAMMMGTTPTEVRLLAFDVDGIVHFSVSASMPAEWTLGNSFPQLSNTELKSLNFSNAQFILATVEIEPQQLKFGMNFRGQLAMLDAGFLTSVQQLIPQVPTTVIVKGTVTNEDNFKLLELKAQIIPGKASFNIVDFLQFEFDVPSIVISAFIYENGNIPAIIKRIESSVTLRGNSGTPVSLPLALQLPTSVTGWQLMIQPNSGTSLADFTEFLTLLGSGGQIDLMGIFTDDLAPVKNVLTSLLLNSFGIEITGDLNTAPSFRSFFFEIEQKVGDKWTLIENVLSLEKLKVYLRTRVVENSHTVDGYIVGNIEVNEEISLQAMVPIPLGNGDWVISSQHSFPLTDLDVFNKFTGGHSITSLLPETLKNGLSNFSLRGMNLIFNPTDGIKRFDLAIAMENPWIVVQDQFELDSLNLDFTLVNTSGTWGLMGNIRAELVAGAIAIDSQVHKDDPDGAWFFELHTNQIVLPSLSDLSRLIGNENALSDTFPEGFFNANLYLNEPRINFNLNSLTLESFGFDLRTEEIQIGEFTILEAGVDVDIDFATERRLKIFGKFKIAGIDFYVEASYEDSNGWQFVGQVGREKHIDFKILMDSLKEHFSLVDALFPDALEDIELYNIEIDFNTKSKDFNFNVSSVITIDGKKVYTNITIALTHDNDKYTRKFSGMIRLGNLEFDLIFNQEQDKGSIFLAAYQNNSGKEETIADLISYLTDDAAILALAGDLKFSLNDALLVIDKSTETTNILFGLDIGGGIDISNLPLVGKMFPSNATLRMTFQPVFAKDKFEEAHLNDLRKLVPAGGFQLPPEVGKGLEFSMHLLIGEEVINLNFPIGSDGTGTAQSSELPTTAPAQRTNEASTAPSTSAGIKWFVVNKNLGPVHFGRVGIAYEASELFLYLDASFSMAGLTISLDGLYMSSKLKPIEPHFGLHGLGIDYKNSALEIGGAFLRQTFNDPQGKPYDTYDGAAIIRTGKFGLSALGSYSYYQGHPSLFIYAYLDAPLGGPAFFFVTGLAAGFGYNRRVVIPSIDKVKDFPLVKQAMTSAPDTTQGLTGVITELHEYIPPSNGENFFAVGIRFSSFEIIDSFVLLTVRFGSEFEIDVLGLSTLVIPTPVGGASGEALAVIQMALKAVFNPDKGYLKVQAGLTSSSFILSRNCHLTGGFAFYTWFKDGDGGATAGEFALTLGGYHPRFKPPAHFPKVAPLGFNWNVGSGLIIKGDFYFALVPSAVMAGGHLNATWSSGNLKAWFDVGADFIISWKPYFYDASMHLDMGVSYTYHFFGTHHISVHVGADLHIWGPDFSGKAHVHLWIVTFNVTFGAGSSRQPPKLLWSDFHKSFLPDHTKWFSSTVTGGLIKKLETDQGSVDIINPKDFKLETSSIVPFTTSLNEIGLVSPSIGAGSMKIVNNIEMNYDVKIYRGTKSNEVTSEFTFKAIKKNVPAAIWGPKFIHDASETSADHMIENANMGFEITGNPAKQGMHSHQVESEKLLNSYAQFNDPSQPFTYENVRQSNNKWLKDKEVQTSVREHIESASSNRANLLKSMNFTADYSPDSRLANVFVLTEKETQQP